MKCHALSTLSEHNAVRPPIGNTLGVLTPGDEEFCIHVRAMTPSKAAGDPDNRKKQHQQRGHTVTRRAANDRSRRPLTVAPTPAPAPPLPDTYTAFEPGGHDSVVYEFLPITRLQWDALWRSPVAGIWGDELAGLLHEWSVWRDRYNRGALQNASSQLRRIEDQLLLTPAAQRRHNVVLEEDMGDGAQTAAVSAAADAHLDAILADILDR